MASNEGRSLYNSSRMVIKYFFCIAIFFGGASLYMALIGELFSSVMFGMLVVVCFAMIYASRVTIRALLKKEPDLKNKGG